MILLYNNVKYIDLENKMKFREKLVRFMSGRYGGDQLNSFVLIVVAILMVVNIFVNSWIMYICYMVLWIWTLFRMLSRNIYKRRAENEKFLKLWNPIKNKWKLMKNKRRDRKTHVYKKCPKCKSVLRLPRQKGKHTVRCPKCSERFDVKI